MTEERTIDRKKVHELADEIMKLFQKSKAPYHEAIFALMEVHAHTAMQNSHTFEEFKWAVNYIADSYGKKWIKATL